MKYLFLLLIFPAFLTAQTLDLSRTEAPDDSTIVTTFRDTSYFLTESGTKEREGKNSIKLYKATYIEEIGGERHRRITSGIVPKPRMDAWLREQRDGWIEGDIKHLQDAIDRLKKLKAQINLELR